MQVKIHMTIALSVVLLAGKDPIATQWQWHKPQTNSSKLTDTDRETLLKQRRYWNFYGSSHYEADSVCPNKKNRDGDEKKKLNATCKKHMSLKELEKK